MADKYNGKQPSLSYWEQYRHLALEGTGSVQERQIYEEYTWDSRPDEGFMISHERPEDHDGGETVVFSRMWVETGTARWSDTGTVSTVERLIVEDLEARTFRPENHSYPRRIRKTIAADLFGRLAVPRLGDMGVWKQVYQVSPDDVLVAFDRYEFEAPRTVMRTTPARNDVGEACVKITWVDDVYASAVYWHEDTWVVLAGSEQ